MAYFDLCVENKWKDGGRGRNKSYLIIHARDGDQCGGHRGNKKWLDPGYILRNEPVEFLDRLAIQEDIKDDSQFWDLKSRTIGFHSLRWVRMGGAIL